MSEKSWHAKGPLLSCRAKCSLERKYNLIFLLFAANIVNIRRLSVLALFSGLRHFILIQIYIVSAPPINSEGLISKSNFLS